MIAIERNQLFQRPAHHPRPGRRDHPDRARVQPPRRRPARRPRPEAQPMTHRLPRPAPGHRGDHDRSPCRVVRPFQRAQRDRSSRSRASRTSFHTRDGAVRAVDGIDFQVDRGEIMGLVGESGCGKSVTSLSIMRLVAPPGRIEAGEIIFDGRDLLKLSNRRDAQAPRRPDQHDLPAAADRRSTRSGTSAARSPRSSRSTAT